MGFDKNRFKESFRVWASNNPRAGHDQALEFCHSNIPPQHMLKQHWLVEQSLQWFEWMSAQRSPPLNAEEFHADDAFDGHSGVLN
jgi:hypothetical protein